MDLTTHLHPVPRVRMTGAMPPILHAFISCTETTLRKVEASLNSNGSVANFCENGMYLQVP